MILQIPKVTVLVLMSTSIYNIIAVTKLMIILEIFLDTPFCKTCVMIG